MRISNMTRRTMPGYLVLLFFLVSAGAAASEYAATEGTYEWSAKLVSFDSESNTVVLRASIERYPGIDGLDGYSTGDRLTLVWTGRYWAAGVRDLIPVGAHSEYALTLPVEFVSTEQADRFLDFRVPVPANSIESIRSMEPDTRVTGISPRSGAAWGQGILLLRHYNDVR